MIPGALYTPTIRKTRGSFEIPYSARFNSADSAYLTRTPVGAGNRRAWTFSFWVKRSKLSTDYITLYSTAGYSNDDVCRFVSGDSLDWYLDPGGPAYHLQTTALFRDVGAWYHIVLAVNTANATASERMKIYVNGSQVTSFAASSYPTQNYDTITNTAVAHQIGRRAGLTAGSYFDGYMAQVCFIDGQSLTPSSFGENNVNGVWRPKSITSLSRGTNGFLLDFSNSASLGEDEGSGTNNFTSSGLTTADQFTDTPTNVFATLNPLWAAATLSDGNLVAASSTAAYQWAPSSIAIPTTGKWVFEAQRTAGTFGYVGICQMGNHNVNTGNNYQIGINVHNGEVVKNSSLLTTVTAPTTSVIRIEYDADADDLVIYDDGVSIYTNTAVGLTGHNSLHFFVAPYSGTTFAVKFGATGFSGTPSTGYKALCTANLPAPSIPDGSAHFQATTYTGNGASRNIDQSGNSTFTPGLVWIKNRDQADRNKWVDVLRGVGQEIKSDATLAEATDAAGVTSFDADGFGLGTGTGGYNDNTERFVAWQWKAGGAGVSNTDGTITSTVSANTTAGFSIVKFTKISGGQTVGHALGVVPKLIILKRLGTADDWYVYHSVTNENYYLTLNSTAAKTYSAPVWNATAPTSSVFSVGATSTGDHIAYCFADIDGYCKIGSYTGNGSADGPLVYCGFKPAFVLWKNASTGATDWYIKDTARDTYNVMTKRIYPNANYAEDINTSNDLIDMVSNGFKIRSSANAATNGSGNTIIFAAFAEHPFGGEGVSPATAR